MIITDSLYFRLNNVELKTCLMGESPARETSLEFTSLPQKLIVNLLNALSYGPLVGYKVH